MDGANSLSPWIHEMRKIKQETAHQVESEEHEEQQQIVDLINYVHLIVFAVLNVLDPVKEVVRGYDVDETLEQQVLPESGGHESVHF